MAKLFAAVTPAKARMILYTVGLAILIAGYLSAALIWRAQDRLEQGGEDGAPLAPLDSRKDSRQIEIYYGKSGLLMERVIEWFDDLTHGKSLAKVLVVTSSAAAIGCFIAAGRKSA